MQQLAPSPSQRGFPSLGLLSLKDMYPIPALAISVLSEQLSKLKHITQGYREAGKWSEVRDRTMSDDDLKFVADMFSSLDENLVNLGFIHTRKAAKRASAGIENKTVCTFDEVCGAYRDVHSRFNDELDEINFFFVPAHRASYWGRDNLLSEQAKNVFAVASQELRLAGSCYCAGLPTASVFHSMRAVESGLRLVASELEISFDGTEQMKVVIDQIKSAARKIESEPKSPLKTANSQHYSELAIEAGLMKDAWRNHVAHNKVGYTEGQAEEILKAVIRFFEKCVSREQPPS